MKQVQSCACYADYSGLCGSGNEQLNTRPDKSAQHIHQENGGKKGNNLWNMPIAFPSGGSRMYSAVNGAASQRLVPR